MASVTTPDNSSQKENKSLKKKKVAKSNAPSTPVSTTVPEDEVAKAADSPDAHNEAPYLRELSKNIRNLKKKLASTQKVDSVIEENPGKSLDELLASRKINADQKAQAEKKPALKASLEQAEEQFEQYKKIDESYQQKSAAEREALDASHQKELEEAKAKVEAEKDKELKEKLLILSRFLRAAAAKRQEGDEASDETRAFEGALLLIYGGTESAVEAMEKLIIGSEEMIPTTEGPLSTFSFKGVRDASGDSAEPSFTAEEAWVDSVAKAEASSLPTEEPSVPIQSDPTVLHAGLTEVEAGDAKTVNGNDGPQETPVQQPTDVSVSGTGNAVAEAHWESKLSQSATSGEGWVEVPRDPAETDTGLEGTTAAPTGTQSWAEDIPTVETAPSPVVNSNNDGFHEVHHNRGGRGRSNNSYGEYRGRGRGGGYRGDRGGEGGGYRGRGGYRGDRSGDGNYRGRGRGGPRGPRGGSGGYRGGEPAQTQ